jgi:hypothetical protein
MPTDSTMRIFASPWAMITDHDDTGDQTARYKALSFLKIRLASALKAVQSSGVFASR